MTVSLRIDGKGPAVVFLHGTPTTPDVFRDIAAEIARDHTTVQVASPAYGKSTPLHQGWTYSDMHDAIETALRGAGVTDATLVGFSGGGYHALALATRARVRVRGVLALGGLANLSDEERAGYAGMVGIIEAGTDLVDATHSKFFSREWGVRPGMRDVTAACVAAVSPAYLAAEIRELSRSENLLPKLADLDVPVVARHGTVDETVTPDKGEAIARAARHGSFEPVPGASHMLLLEDREGTLASLRRLLARTR